MLPNNWCQPQKTISLPYCVELIVLTIFCIDQAQRRGIKYELLPPGMQRRKQNSSRFDRRSRTIFWHIHWHFPAANESVHDVRVSEQTPLKQILQQHISLAPGNSVKRHALRLYVEAGLENLQILMKKEHCPVRSVPVCSSDRTNLSIASCHMPAQRVVEYMLQGNAQRQYSTAVPFQKILFSSKLLMQVVC